MIDRRGLYMIDEQRADLRPTIYRLAQEAEANISAQLRRYLKQAATALGMRGVEPVSLVFTQYPDDTMLNLRARVSADKDRKEVEAAARAVFGVGRVTHKQGDTWVLSADVRMPLSVSAEVYY